MLQLLLHYLVLYNLKVAMRCRCNFHLFFYMQELCPLRANHIQEELNPLFWINTLFHILVYFFIAVAFVYIFCITPSYLSTQLAQLCICDVCAVFDVYFCFFHSLRQQYKERLNLPIKSIIGYQSHDDTSSKSGSTTKNMYSVWRRLSSCRFIKLQICITL